MAGTAAHGQKPTEEQVFWQELQLWGDLGWSSLFLKNWTLRKGSVLEQGKTEEEVAETVLTTDCNSHSTCAS